MVLDVALHHETKDGFIVMFRHFNFGEMRDFAYNSAFFIVEAPTIFSIDRGFEPILPYSSWKEGGVECFARNRPRYTLAIPRVRNPMHEIRAPVRTQHGGQTMRLTTSRRPIFEEEL